MTDPGSGWRGRGVLPTANPRRGRVGPVGDARAAGRALGGAARAAARKPR